MLTRIPIHRRLRPSLPCRAYSSNPHSSPYDGFTKLRAFPFQMTPEHAQRHMAKWAALLTGSGKIFTSALASFLPLSDYCRPIRLTPVYFPAWIINAEVEAGVIYEKTQQNAVTVFRDTYIPGAHIPVLSAAPLWSQTLIYDEPEPFTPALLHQHGEPIECIPFSVSPFALLDIPAKAEESSWSVAQYLEVRPATVKPTLFSASPVLLPLYLAQYQLNKWERAPEAPPNDSEGDEQTITLFIQAHGDYGAIMSERLPNKEGPAGSTFKFVNDLGLTDEFDLDSEVLDLSLTSPTRIHIPHTSLRPLRDSTSALTDWLEHYLRSSSYIAQLAEMSAGRPEVRSSSGVAVEGLEEQRDETGVEVQRDGTGVPGEEQEEGTGQGTEEVANDEDPRIRERSEEEGRALDVYFDLGAEVVMIKRIVEAMAEASESTKVLQIGQGGLPKLESAEEASSALKSKLRELEARREEVKPGWWGEFEGREGEEKREGSEK